MQFIDCEYLKQFIFSFFFIISTNADLIHQQQQHNQLVAQRKQSYDTNGNQRSTKEYYNLPDVNQHRLNNQANRFVAKQSAKKTIKVFGSFIIS